MGQISPGVLTKTETVSFLCPRSKQIHAVNPGRLCWQFIFPQLWNSVCRRQQKQRSFILTEMINLIQLWLQNSAPFNPLIFPRLSLELSLSKVFIKLKSILFFLEFYHHEQVQYFVHFHEKVTRFHYFTPIRFDLSSSQVSWRHSSFRLNRKLYRENQQKLFFKDQHYVYIYANEQFTICCIFCWRIIRRNNNNNNDY